MLFLVGPVFAQEQQLPSKLQELLEWEKGYNKTQTDIQPFIYRPNQTEWSTYDDQILGISIQYPKGWEVQEEPDTVSFRYGWNEEIRNYNVSVAVLVKPVSPFESAKGLMEDTMNKLRGQMEIHSIEDNITLAGKPAYRVDVSGDLALSRGIYYFMADEENYTGYGVMCLMMEKDYANYKPMCHKMADSLRIKSDSESMNPNGKLL